VIDFFCQTWCGALRPNSSTLFREKSLSPEILPNKSCLFSLFQIVLSRTNILTEACKKLRCSSWGFCSFSEHCTVWPWCTLAGTSTPWKIGNCQWQCFPFVDDLSHCGMMDSKLFGNGPITLPRWMGNHQCSSKIIDDVFPSWHCVNTHLDAPDLPKVSAFTEVLTPANNHLIKCVWLAVPGC